MLAMRRYPSTVNDVINMPGRGTFTFLVIGNLAAWVQRTMEVKQVGQGGSESVAWLLLTNISLPLLLFYRFHSSVCFADVWHVAYKPLCHDVTNIATPSSAPRLPRSAASSDTTSQTQHEQQQTYSRPADMISLTVPRIVITAPTPTTAGLLEGRSRSSTLDSESSDVIVDHEQPLASDKL